MHFSHRLQFILTHISARSRDHFSDTMWTHNRSSHRSPSRERNPHDEHREWDRLPSSEGYHHERRDRRSRSPDRSHSDWDREGESDRDRSHHDHDHDHDRHTHHDHNRHTHHDYDRHTYHDYDRHTHHDRDDVDRDHERDRRRLKHEEDCDYAPENHHKRKRGDSMRYVVQFELHIDLILIFSRLYVGSLQCSLLKDDIQKVFEPFGDLEFVEIHHDKDLVTGRIKCYAFVEYVRHYCDFFYYPVFISTQV